MGSATKSERDASINLEQKNSAIVSTSVPVVQIARRYGHGSRVSLFSNCTFINSVSDTESDALDFIEVNW